MKTWLGKSLIIVVLVLVAEDACLGAEPAVVVWRHYPSQPDLDRAILESDLALRLGTQRGATPAQSCQHGSGAHRHGRTRRLGFPVLQSQLHQRE